MRPPPAGWQVPQAEGAPSDRPGRPALDAELLNNILGALRDVIPPELQERLAHALRELLLAVRALIDWYVERLERRREEPPEVRDIPIL